MLDASTQASKFGRKPQQIQRERALKVSGVGNGSQSARFDCIVPMALQQTSGNYVGGSFELPTVDGSDLPALLGLNSLKCHRAILDMNTMKLHFCGPGDYDLEKTLPPGTESYELKEAPSGHLILPCGYHKELAKQESTGKANVDKEQVSLLTSTARGSGPRGRAAAARGQTAAGEVTSAASSSK